MENAVVYARYSSHSQTEQSIEGQLAAAYKYAQDHSYKIIHEYCDRAKTGTNDNREQFQKMLKDSAKHKFTVIIVWKVDRFGRNREEISINKHRVKKNGVRVEYVAENISQGPEGVILESVLEGMAEYYSLQLSQNVARGYLESAKKYHVIGKLPLGYDKAPDKTYAINPEEAKIVQLIFDKYNSGYSQAEIVRWLNGNGYTNKSRPFTKSTLQRMLNDERYIGTYSFKDIIKEENIIPPILTREVFYANRTPMATWNYDEYRLSKYLYCNCGRKMKGSSGNGKMGVKYNYYLCPKCRNSIRSYKLELAVDKAINNVLNNDNIINGIACEVYQYYIDHKSDSSEEDSLKYNLEQIERKISNLVLSIENGVSPEIIAPRITELNATKADIELQLSKISLDKPFEVTQEAVVYFLKHVEPDVFINKIVLSDSEAVIALNCTDTEVAVDCSTIAREMGKMGQESNFIALDKIVLLKIPTGKNS